jgi:hypothetical protein
MQTATEEAVIASSPQQNVSIAQVVARALAPDGVTLLDAAIACFLTPLDAEECAPVLYAQMKPALTDMANTLAAVWWSAFTDGTQSLVTALTDCTGTGWSAADITAAAKAAMEQYRDILLRKALDDTGVVPYTGTSIAASPDIIPGGITQNADPATAYGASTYGSDPGGPVIASNVNFIYLRGKNLFPAAEPPNTHTAQPQFFAYSSSGSIIFDSTNWEALDNVNGTKSVNVSGASGDVVVGTSPFEFTPKPKTHYCLIGRVVTEFNPNPVPDTSTIHGSLEWLRTHPGYSWKNLDPVSPAAMRRKGIDAVLQYRNPDPETRTFALVIHARNLRGVRVAVTAETSLLAVEPRTIVSDEQQVSTLVTLPPHFSGELRFRLEAPPDAVVTETSSVELRCYALLAPDHPGFRHTEAFMSAGIEPLLTSGLDAGTLPAFLGNYAFICR